MKTNLQHAIALIAPFICITTLWEPDEDARFSELAKPGCAFEDEDSGDWEAWQSEVQAKVIELGQEVTGSAYLGGNWEKYGDAPAVSNPEISGYERHMTLEALEELAKQVSTQLHSQQIATAIAHILSLPATL